MLASLVDSQTGQEPRKGSQDLHEQRCLQGRKRTHDLLVLQFLQANFFPFSSTTRFSCSITTLSLSLCPPLSHEPQQDSASSASLLTKTSLSLTCSSVLLRSMTMVSFALAILCHVSLSISAFLKQSWSSMALLVACAKCSSFCLIKLKVLDSKFLNRAASCCFLCSCKANLSFSFCFKERKKKHFKSFNFFSFFFI